MNQQRLSMSEATASVMDRRLFMAETLIAKI